MKRLLAVLLAVLVSAGAALGAVTPKPAALVLKPAQVGKGYFLIIVGGGQSLKRRTIDICNARPPSEKLRVARAEVGFARSDKDPVISNQIVVYKPGGAAQAMRDIVAAVKRCPSGPVVSGQTSITTRIATLHPKGTFLPGAIVLGYHGFGTVSGRPVSQYAAVVYQRRGNVLSAVTAHGSTLAKRLAALARAGTASARNLQRG